MKLKGWKKLQRKLRKAVYPNFPSITLEIGAVDDAIVSRKLVHFGILRDNVSDDDFIKNLYKSYPNAVVLPAYMYSLLHEIGHIKTPMAMKRDDDKLRQKLMDKGDNFEYFQLPAEQAATAWAVRYARKNTWMTKRMARRIENAMRDFISENITE